jgi:cobyrinic acid a,c-diamide synthase
VKKAITISAIASNQGKTVLTTALLHHFKNSVRPFKIGPDFIDPQFHQKVASTPSINLDTFMMDEEQVKWVFDRYADKDMAILEGVMGFYDGMDKGCSAYDVSTLLQIPTIMILDGSATYITISAVLKGLKTYRNNNTIRAVVFNKLSSEGHYQLIKKQIEHDHMDIKVLGWIPNHLESLDSIHLGLNLSNENLKKLDNIACEVLQHIDTNEIKNLAQSQVKVENYPFEKIPKSGKTLAIIHDKNFSFLYHDNLEFFKEVFAKVVKVNPSKNEPIDADIVYIPGGYVETYTAYQSLKDAKLFRDSLIIHAKTKPIYAECAGFIYLGNRIDDKKMSGILDIDFEMQKRFTRLGYYEIDGIKGHCFHCSKPIKEDIMSKQNNKVYGTYLHTFFRNHTDIVKERFEI